MKKREYPYQRVAAARAHAREARKLLRAAKRELSTVTVREISASNFIDDAIVAVNLVCKLP